MTAHHILPDFDEANSSQIPAILQLINLGYTYIPRHEVDNYRDSKSQYILRDIAIKALREINPSEISDKSIDEAIFGLEKIKLDDGAFDSGILASRSSSSIGISSSKLSSRFSFIVKSSLADN